MAQVTPHLVSIGRRERNFNINVGSFSTLKKHSDPARWVCIYPAYLNSKKSVTEGRQIPASLAIENPTCGEIRDVLMAAGFKVEYEPHKVYPRELMKYEMLSRGRVRVQIKNDDNTPVNPLYKDRKSLFLYTAETIPKLKSRGASAAKPAQSEQNQAKSSSTKKKNKK